MLGCAAGVGPDVEERGVAATTWSRIAESPLVPRHGAVGAWTGEELAVVGGSTDFTCPPGADCIGERDDTYRKDGAAYDPATDTWRAIEDAPEAFLGGLAAWSGQELVVVSGTLAFAYDPAGDAWRRLDPPRRPELNQTVVTDAGIVFGSYDSHPRAAGPPDWPLDPAAGAWSALPQDGLGQSYDRSLAWDGQRLWLLSMSVDHHFEAYDGAVSRVAVLDSGE